jgi:nucleoside recognition membrane protein YjiH
LVDLIRFKFFYCGKDVKRISFLCKRLYNGVVKLKRHDGGVMKKKPVTLESYITLAGVIGFTLLFTTQMGASNFFNTVMNTSYVLLRDIAFYIMAIAVLTGALSAILSEFGIIAMMNVILAPLTKIIYNLPGVASLGAITAYFSDNPAVIALAKEKEFSKHFKRYQIPVLCNLGTSFGMGLIIATFMIGLGSDFIGPTVLGVVASIVGSAVSVRMLSHYAKKYYNVTDKDARHDESDQEIMRLTREGSYMNRLLESALDGGKNGVEIGLQIIPGILLISTFVIMLTNEPPVAGFTGAAKEGIGLLPVLGGYLMPIFRPLFGFTSPEAIAFPLTSLGSAGAALGFVPTFLDQGVIGMKEIAVFTAMGTTYSGYLSTHISMMDALGARKLAGKAIFAHTIGGLVSGIVANYLYMLIF